MGEDTHLKVKRKETKEVLSRSNPWTQVVIRIDGGPMTNA